MAGASPHLALLFLLAACPHEEQPGHAGLHLYCKRCGAPLLACDELEHVSSPHAWVRIRTPRVRASAAKRLPHAHAIATSVSPRPARRSQAASSTSACGVSARSQILPHTIGSLAVRVRMPSGDEHEIEASGSSFVHFLAVRDVHDRALRTAEPFDACSPLAPAYRPRARDEQRSEPQTSEGMSDQVSEWAGALILVQRGNCTFHDKAMAAQRAGAAGVIVVDTERGPVAGFTMSGERTRVGRRGAEVPACLLPALPPALPSPALPSARVRVRRFWAARYRSPSPHCITLTPCLTPLRELLGRPRAAPEPDGDPDWHRLQR
jgi:hypothetical protein